MHCDKDAELVKDICDFLDDKGYITIPTSETSNDDFNISIGDENHLRNTVDLFQKTLVVYTDLTSLLFLQAVDKIMSFDEFHNKIHFLIFNTDVATLQIPDAIRVAFTDITMLATNGLRLLRDGTGMKPVILLHSTTFRIGHFYFIVILTFTKPITWSIHCLYRHISTFPYRRRLKLASLL